MKIGICSSAANYFSTWDERFSHLRSLGYEAVDHSLENINLDYVESIGNGYLTMKNGEEIPVAMANLQSVNDAFELHHTGGTIK